MPDQTLLNRARRWLRISVRGVIVLVLVIGVGMGWIVRRARIQRDAVAAIENAGAQRYPPRSGSRSDSRAVTFCASSTTPHSTSRFKSSRAVSSCEG